MSLQVNKRCFLHGRQDMITFVIEDERPLKATLDNGSKLK